MTAVTVGAGLALVAIALRDVLHELFHPGGSGAIASRVMRGLWRIFRWLGGRWPSSLLLAGPIILVAVLTAWGLMLAFGWALVYWPFLPDEFRFASPLTPAGQDSFADALYMSLVALSTLGFGDVTPTIAWLRVATTAEAFIGFGLLTAGISWILMLYPVLTRRRAFANLVLVLDEADMGEATIVEQREPADAARLLDDLTARLTVLRTDLMLSPISYYFHDNEPSVALPRALPRVLDAAEQAIHSGGRSVRHAAVALRAAIDGFAATVGSGHLDMKGEKTATILAAYTREHPHRER